MPTSNTFFSLNALPLASFESSIKLHQLNIERVYKVETNRRSLLTNKSKVQIENQIESSSKRIHHKCHQNNQTGLRDLQCLHFSQELRKPGCKAIPDPEITFENDWS